MQDAYLYISLSPCSSPAQHQNWGDVTMDHEAVYTLSEHIYYTSNQPYILELLTIHAQMK